MSDFKTITDFKKSALKQYPYQDPTFLSFVMLFDYNDNENSPLLSDAAEIFIKKLADSEDGTFYKERLESLQNFKKALKTINNEMPWFWQSVNGLDKIQQYNPENAYLGGPSALLTITTLESINLTVSGLMHLYRKAIFDERKWTYILPANLRKFRMFIYVTEVRTIQNLNKMSVSGASLDSFPDNFKPTINTVNENKDISGSGGRPFFMFGLSYCEFDITSGTSIFADISKNPEMAAGEIKLTYEALDRIESRVLNGIITTVYGNNVLSPAPDSENQESTTSTLKDFAMDKINGKVSEIEARAREDLKRLAEQKKNELTQLAKDATINRIPSVDNIYSNFIKGIDNATDLNAQKKAIGNAISQNIYGVSVGDKIPDVLNKAAKNALGNVND